jgi:hypothetical protein
MGGAIQKLTIGTYKILIMKKGLKNAFKAFINPTGYSLTYKTELNPNRHWNC